MSESRKVEEFQRQFPIPLTASEKAVWREKLTNTLDEIDETTIKKDAAMEKFKDELKSMEGTVGNLRRELRVGELRDVDCERVYDFKNGDVTETRLDTGEVLSKRKVTEFERQTLIPGVG